MLHRAQFWYSRHLRVVEVYVHLLHPDVWEALDDSVKAFLQEVRSAAESSEPSKVFGPGDEEDGDEAGSDSDDEGDPKRADFDPREFSSALHSDVSRVLFKCLDIQHHNRLAAGPLTVDMCHVPSMTVVEAAERWQYYLRSAQFTALARRRHELLRAMGFKLVLIPYHRWNVLKNDAEKAEFLRSKLPREVLASSHEQPERRGQEELKRGKA